MIEDSINIMAEFDQYINDIKKYSNADDERIKELKDVITLYIIKVGGTATGVLSYVRGQLQKGEVLNGIIQKLRKDSYIMNSFRNEAYGVFYTEQKTQLDMEWYCRRIKDVNILVENKVVEVTFADGTKEKAVCQEPDVFSLETAIAICLSKKIMGGSSAYNNAVKHGVKVYEDKIKEVEKAKAEQERIAKKRAKRLAYKERKIAKRKAQECEEKIEIQKEAYIRAMIYMNDASKNVAVME